MPNQDSRRHNSFDPRFAAFNAVEDILRRGLTLDQAEADRVPADAGTRDRAFCRRLVYAVLRHKGEIDALMRRYLKQTPSGRGRAIESVLRIGLAQVLYTDVPAYAAVDATVSLTRPARLGGFAKLVNAIMRRAADEAADAAGSLDPPRLNTPDWLWRTWRDAFGEDGARSIAEAHRREPPLDIACARPGEAAAWAERLNGSVIGLGCVRLWPDGPVSALPGFDQGAWWVQDVAARLPVRLLGDVAGRRVADLCAAPGGKTLQLAAAGAAVTAVDRSAARLRRLSENLARTGLAADIVTADATAWRPAEPFDAVLIDAPCSATGTIRRHPDIPWLRGPADVKKLAALQTRLFRHAIDLVQAGGTLVYCTCSLQPEEGAAIVDAAVADGLPIERLPVNPIVSKSIPELARAVTAAGDFRTRPDCLADRGGMDGFFAARLRRR